MPQVPDKAKQPIHRGDRIVTREWLQNLLFPIVSGHPITSSKRKRK